MKRKCFVSDEENESLLTNGYIIINNVPLYIIDELQKVFNDSKNNYEDGLQLSIKNSDEHQKRDIHFKTSNIAGDFLSLVFDQFKPIFSGFINKEPNNINVAGVHRDPSLTDETQFPTLLFWCPLVDTNEFNGAISVIPKSHKIFIGFKGLGKGKYDFSEHENEIQNKYGKKIFLKKGEALIMNTALLHFSDQNKTEKDRPVYSCFLIPTETEIICYHHNPQSNSTDVYTVNEEVIRNYYSKYISMDELPFPLLSRNPFLPPIQVSFQNFEKHYASILKYNRLRWINTTIRNWCQRVLSFCFAR